MKLDSFEQIKALFTRSEEPTKEEALQIREALYDVFQRLMRVRQVAPSVDYSARLWRLLELVGLPNKSLKRQAVPR